MPSLVIAVALFGVSLGALLGASHVFTSAAERLGLALGISPFLIGATVVAGGTSLPELVSSVLAVVADEPGIVLGLVVGSNVANILLVIGLAAVATRPIRIERELVRVDLPLLMASAVFLVLAAWDGTVSWPEGVLGLAGLAIYVHFSLSTRSRLDETVEELFAEHAGVVGGTEGRGDATDADSTAVDADADSTAVDAGDNAAVGTSAEGVTVEPSVGARTYATLVASLLVVFVAADQFVESILSIASTLGVGTELIAMTAVAVGTSLPEIAVSVTATRRGSSELTVGNVLGSNVFNTFAVVGVPSLLGPLSVPANVRGFALPVMVLATLLYYFVTQDREITRWEGITFVVLYAVFVLNVAG
ncbi:putative membrane protein [Halolamina pelagica]|uniref:Putative membrane protein n=1 Tax=Halolamina pelagica TaxID=699431 RepID=A0A0P7GKG8_9EURY|nr:calcium/sodium antiporter [Halolamina pelagica]KPN29058.1 putative membrane protein [Halolamina pelagica]